MSQRIILWTDCTTGVGEGPVVS